MEITYQEIKKSVKNKQQMYGILAKEYYLPDFNSKAISNDYMLQYTYAQIPIFVMKKKFVIHHHFPYRKFTVAELLEKLEELLKSRQYPPTGLDIISLPDREWVLNAILHVDPQDTLQLLKNVKTEDVNLSFAVNEEYIFILFSFRN